MEGLTHFDKTGNAIMVDVSGKNPTARTATAQGRISMKQETLRTIEEGKIGKGDVLGVARVAGIMAAKKTSELIPMCHPLMLTKCSVDFDFEKDSNSIKIMATVKTMGQTGVEMEALTAASAAALTIYDMCKAIDKDMVIGDICLLEKTGGKSGTYIRHTISGT
ncbi:cyclic pyranopterin monophosphate synthase MoaC [Desulfitibacter alkalitolerans]|uniref:cyclic pyranopterin monophosphate synthase MoaC n=1 Tax=Desulfitibacter alkalitolerans TaxID=264641 RepID=UPI000489756D|nr:cyclic pyranopterin monophosphate synthase MoaC [Desulfitibacter alkalitolerans]